MYAWFFSKISCVISLLSKVDLDLRHSESINKFACEVHIKSLQEAESPIICVGSLIICCNPNVEVITLILEPSYVVLSP